jgi:hypothetical protein
MLVLCCIEIQFREMRPLSLNGERLYDRNTAARELATTLVVRDGRRSTPYMDACYGAGKTSLALKFREYLGDWQPPLGSHDRYRCLQEAIYVHCQFDDSADLCKAASGQIEFVRCILGPLATVLEASALEKLDLNISDLKTFALQLAKLARNVSFIIHFDEIGMFEVFDDALARHFLLALVSVTEELRDVYGHFVILTGRSCLIRTLVEDTVNDGYKLPRVLVPISLPPLSHEAVNSMIRDSQLSHVLHIDLVSAISGGIPRAVRICMQQAALGEYPRRTEKSLEMSVLRACSGDQRFHQQDLPVFLKCLELAWSRMDIADRTTLFGKPIAGVVARLGIFTRPSELEGFFQLVIPIYLIHSVHPSFRSLISISSNSSAGNRLECAFRRAFHLRHCLLSPINWTDSCLRFLDDCGVPFPAYIANEVRVFPKISSGGSSKKADVLSFMEQAVRESDENNHGKVEFTTRMMPIICDLMTVGYYYESLPMPGSADAKIRISRRVMVDLQFKNLPKPFTKSQLETAVPKSRMVGWTVILVIICSQGHNLSSSDHTEFMEGVQCVLLSRSSVASFFGDQGLQNIQSQRLLADALAGAFNSPLEANYYSPTPSSIVKIYYSTKSCCGSTLGRGTNQSEAIDSLADTVRSMKLMHSSNKVDCMKSAVVRLSRTDIALQIKVTGARTLRSGKELSVPDRTALRDEDRQM